MLDALVGEKFRASAYSANDLNSCSPCSGDLSSSDRFVCCTASSGY
jgi:hypothetical protein